MLDTVSLRKLEFVLYHEQTTALNKIEAVKALWADGYAAAPLIETLQLVRDDPMVKDATSIKAINLLTKIQQAMKSVDIKQVENVDQYEKTLREQYVG